MAYGLEVFNSAGEEIVNSISPFVIARRVQITGGVGAAVFSIPNMPTGSLLTIVTGLMGGTADEIINNGGSGDIMLNTYVQSTSNITFNVIASTANQAPPTLSFTVLARRP